MAAASAKFECMRTPLPLSLSAIAFTALTLAACVVANDEGPEESSPPAETAEPAGEGTEPSSEASENPDEDSDIYVTQITTLEGDGEYYSAHRPDELTLTEFTNAFDLTWQTWGPETAVASGLISGSWCWEDCQDGYEATIVLCDVQADHFVRFGVFGDFPGYDPEDTQLGSPLYFSGIEYSDAEWYGCEEP